MPSYRLVFADVDGTSVIRSVNFVAQDAGGALLMAQRHKGATELWKDDEHLCTLHRSGRNGEIWIISGNGRRPVELG